MASIDKTTAKAQGKRAALAIVAAILAGGAGFGLPAYVGFADDEESLDLKRQTWVEDSRREPA